VVAFTGLWSFQEMNRFRSLNQKWYYILHDYNVCTSHGINTVYNIILYPVQVQLHQSHPRYMRSISAHIELINQMFSASVNRICHW
jgi:hypothetical protein